MSSVQENSLPRDFKGIWIPKEVWLDKRLTYFEKCLLSEIHSLDSPEKGCYAKNQYLMDFFGEKERTIQCGLSKLKNLGYIIYQDFDGRTRILRSNLYPDKSLFNTPEVQDSAPQQCRNLHPSSVGSSIEPENIYKGIYEEKEINKEKGLAPLKPRSSPPSKRKSVKEESKEMASRVLITPSQHADLVKRAKDDEKLVQQWYDRLSQWKIGKEIEGGKDYSAITNWVIDAVKEKPSLQKPSESNKEWAIKKIDELNNMGAIERSRATVNVESESVSVSFKGYGPQADKFLKFSEHGFKDQLTNLFNKIGITMPNL